MFTELLSGLASLFSEAGALGTHDNSKHIDFSQPGAGWGQLPLKLMRR